MRAAAQLAPGRPALWLGLRTAAATALFLALAGLLPPATATWAPIAGYSVALADKGGAYRARARAMVSVVLGSLVAVAIGSLVAGTGPLAVVVVTLGAAACALGHAWGAPGAGIGTAITIHLTIAAFLPLGPDAVVPAVVGFALGAVWALFLGLVVWPVRVYKPGRRAVASVLDALADFAIGLTRADDDVIQRHRAIRERLELARQTLIATRRGRRGESGRGERLLAMVHAGDHMFGALVSLEEVLDASRPAPPAHGGRLTPPAPAVVDGLERLGAALRELADRVLVEGRQRPADAAGAPAPGPPPRDHALLLVARLDDERRRVDALIDSLVDETEPLPGPRLEDDPPLPIRERLHATLDLDSAVLRHALRVACCVGAAAAIASLLQLHHGYWITITTFVLLQPSRAATTTRAVQRGVGTMVGGIVAAGVAWLVRDPLAMMVIIVALAGLSASVLQLNYGLYSIFATPTFVLLAEVHTQDFTLVEVRITYTLAAGALAFVASAVLWPSREHRRFNEDLGLALEHAARYLAAAHQAVATTAPLPAPEVVATRRRFGLAVNNAELALERVVAERAPAELTEARMTMVAACRRLGAAINAFGSTRALLAARPHEPALAAFVGAAERHLDDLAAAARATSGPPPWTRGAPELADPVLAARLGRIASQLTVVTEAISRAAATTG